MYGRSNASDPTLVEPNCSIWSESGPEPKGFLTSRIYEELGDGYVEGVARRHAEPLVLLACGTEVFRQDSEMRSILLPARGAL